MKPCRGCGGPKPGGRGVMYCADCRERRQPMALRAEKKRSPEYMQRLATKTRGKAPSPSVWPVGMAWCGLCQTYLPVKDFGRRKTKKGIAPYCKPCESNQRFTARLHTKYGGMTVDQYDRLLSRQGGGCAICGMRPKSRRLAVDHDHKTGKVRGLLCRSCNHKLLGGAHDSVDLLRKAIHYLQHPPARAHLAVVPSGKRYVTRRARR